jgi:hypothetical protein
LATFNIEDAAYAGVGLLAKKPVAAIVWALTWTLFFVVVSAPFIGIAARMVTVLASSQGHPNPTAVLPLAGALIAWGLLLWVGSLMVGAVVQSAAIRAILEPDHPGLSYLRVGPQEAQVLAVNFVRSLLLFGVSILTNAVIGIATLIAAGGGRGAALTIHFIGDVTSFALIAWITVRLSMAAPMSFTERRFQLFESWTMTRGLDLRLIAVAVITAMIVLVIYLIALCVAVGASVLLWSGGLRPVDFQNLLSQSPAVWGPVFAPFLVMIGAASLIAGAVITPIALAPWPNIYRLLAAQAEPEAS